jgi:CheY-like chemotaxis protein
MANEPFVIVVADDDPLLNALVCEVLADEGYDVRCSFTGAEAMRIIQRVRPDLVITDMQMEVRDAGLQVLQSLRQTPATISVAVIICSADREFLQAKFSEIARYHAEIIAKPFELGHLLATVQRLLATSQP